MEFDLDLRSRQQVRNCVTGAKIAAQKLANFSQEQLDTICAAISQAGSDVSEIGRYIRIAAGEPDRALHSVRPVSVFRLGCESASGIGGRHCGCAGNKGRERQAGAGAGWMRYRIQPSVLHYFIIEGKGEACERLERNVFRDYCRGRFGFCVADPIHD